MNAGLDAQKGVGEEKTASTSGWGRLGQSSAVPLILYCIFQMLAKRNTCTITTDCVKIYYLSNISSQRKFIILSNLMPGTSKRPAMTQR